MAKKKPTSEKVKKENQTEGSSNRSGGQIDVDEKAVELSQETVEDAINDMQKILSQSHSNLSSAIKDHLEKQNDIVDRIVKEAQGKF